ncbi:MAG: LPS export ABC transporter periplasmic protein LptC [Rhodospirillales bacterium]|jgi:lipopolysaccharide export system protein LptC|nr:LPS export ABC transporter periplasmic protein LptC [Rhodospirillales bacterium]
MSEFLPAEDGYQTPVVDEDESRSTRSLLKAGPIRRLHPFYSYLVRILKVIFPVVAILLVLLVVAWPYLQRNTMQFTLDFSMEEAINEDEPTMINPRFTGLDTSRLPFSITADIARNMILDTTRVELEMPKADITMSDGSWLLITAQEGVYGRTAEVLDLSGNVNLFHDKGYEITTDVVHIDLLDGTAESATPVSGHGPIGDLNSEGFRMNNKSQVIHFTGKAVLHLYPDVMGNMDNEVDQ